jgi:pyruvate/2-oxoglutarate dehydrogenase complex dihydrolipoamide dehydrogenase (E3) component
MEKHDVVIIGGGIGGLTAAYGALYNGLTVTVVEKQPMLGGESLYHNCIPTKTLLHTAKVAHLVRSANRFGIDAYLLTTDLSKVNDHIDDVVSRMEAIENSDWLVKMGGRVINGMPKFIDPNTLMVGNVKLQSKKFILATGSRAVVPNIPGLAEIGYITNETVFQKLALPQKLIILGGGCTGIEFAQAFSRLGSKVIVIEHSSQILQGEDPELVWILRGALEKEGIEFYPSTYVQEAFYQNKKKVLVCCNSMGEKFAIESNEVLVATGRLPNTEGLNLEAAGIHYDVKGIYVDKFLRTSNKNIYAVGDVINGQHKYSHVAEYQANSVVNHLLFKLPFNGKNKVIPKVIFTDPELAQVGLTEQEAAKQRFNKVEILRLDLQDNDRAITCDAFTGRIKLLVVKNKIVGASLLGPQAGELICELALAINVKANLEDIAMTLHPYPTFAQINRRVVNRHINNKGVSRCTKKIISIAQKVFA